MFLYSAISMNGFHSSSVISLLMCWEFRAGKHIERKSIYISIPGFSEVSFGTPNNSYWSLTNSHPVEWDFLSPQCGWWGGDCVDLHTVRGCCSTVLLPLVQLQSPPFSPFIFQLLGMLPLVFMLLLSILCVGPHGMCGGNLLKSIWAGVKLT